MQAEPCRRRRRLREAAAAAAEESEASALPEDLDEFGRDRNMEKRRESSQRCRAATLCQCGVVCHDMLRAVWWHSPVSRPGSSSSQVEWR